MGVVDSRDGMPVVVLNLTKERQAEPSVRVKLDELCAGLQVVMPGHVEGVAMTALTLRLPDEKHRSLKALAQSRGTPINRLLEEMTTLMLTEFDAETRFNVRAARGAGRDEQGLALLQKTQGDPA